MSIIAERLWLSSRATAIRDGGGTQLHGRGAKVAYAQAAPQASLNPQRIILQIAIHGAVSIFDVTYRAEQNGSEAVPSIEVAERAARIEQ
ncbi:hypothetical protein [Craurococcus roseus]|uniref:hypothetical protein n=1 Tax=Craurococcus roseus TaxID=77585 RepID=UPI0031D2D5E6